MARRADTSERLQAVEIIADDTALMTEDGRPVHAFTEYPATTIMAPDGRPVRAATIDPLATSPKDGPIIPYAEFATGAMTPDGRPIEALAFFTAAGAPAPLS